ncbi:MAG: hypothetical protein GX924_01535 [Clostridiaceae bacterium]|nr:hypothetical protein [Clostridiaceae bacterium]
MKTSTLRQRPYPQAQGADAALSDYQQIALTLSTGTRNGRICPFKQLIRSNLIHRHEKRTHLPVQVADQIEPYPQARETDNGLKKDSLAFNLYVP